MRGRSPGRVRSRKASVTNRSRSRSGSRPRSHVVHVDEFQDNARPVRYECTSTGKVSKPTRIKTSREVAESNANFPQEHEQDAWGVSALYTMFVGWMYKIFLPEGFPKSVSDDYLPYQVWDTVQAFCSTVTGILASKSALAGLGVGNAEARIGAALYFGIVKRNVGKVSRIVFTTAKGSDLDNNAKTWRVVADVLNDLASAFELLAPMLCVAGSDCSEQWRYSIMVIAAEVFRSVVGVAGGASRAALTQHFAVRDNFGDVNAKDGSQEMFVEIVGSFVGLSLAALGEGDGGGAGSERGMLGAFVVFTVLHVAANVMACRTVALLTLNRQRAHILCTHFLRDGSVRSPAQVAAEESVVYFGGTGVAGARIWLGARLPALGALCDVAATVRKAGEARYLLGERTHAGLLHVGMRREVLVGFHAEAEAEDLIRGYLHAYLVALGGRTREESVQLVEELLERLPAQGWRLDAAHVGAGTVRLEWDQDMWD